MWYGRTNKVDFESQIANKTRFAALLRRMQAQDTRFTPLADQRRQKKDDIVALQEAYEHATPEERDRIRKAIKEAAIRERAAHERRARAQGKKPRRRQAVNEFPHGVDPLAHYAIGVTHRKTLNIYNWLAEHEGDPAITVRLFSLRPYP